MAKLSGKDLEFWFDGIEHPVISAEFDKETEIREVTTSATPEDGKDYIPLRTGRIINIETLLFAPDGNEVASGTLTAETTYRVTGGTITSGGKSYAVGQVFRSDGTETATAVNKVKPLGVTLDGKTLALTIGGTTVPLTDADINMKFDELEVTDTSTDPNSREFITARADRDSSVNAILHDTTADQIAGSGTNKAVVLTFAANNKITGTALLSKENIISSVKDYVKQALSLKWIGKPTELNLGLPMAIEKAVKIIHKRGATTNKEYLGNAIVISKSIKANFNGETTMSMQLRVNGAVTQNVAN